jgi:hypothetical protein
VIVWRLEKLGLNSVIAVSPAPHRDSTKFRGPFVGIPLTDLDLLLTRIKEIALLISVVNVDATVSECSHGKEAESRRRAYNHLVGFL